ncbi:helix-turn-helix domain-containing protein [Caulobacter henricii]|uniref:Chromosomal replication initiator DnaA C-terminal domain-containing protein n=1 Tax=Caulobacter henricii TaxID=69395 RepID=A0A0P0P291_9CAUL|nr:helix-turn-helix domain-containing protein [Caulobacter henricii]ALL14286.1 hypothetical protein AQ619_13550 [Caulobacter henricii]
MLVRDVIRATAVVGDMSVEALTSQDKTRDVARLRQLGILVSSRVSPASWPAIGRYWGGRDHTTVLHSAGRASEYLEAGDLDILHQLARILDQLGLTELPADRPASALQPRASLGVIRARIRVTEARLAVLKTQELALEGAAR